ncbi:altronate dehydratase family protein [Mesorhizobium sp. BAC0120]|uniref:UxaA family hydrolase n=1 Tax=Mesorhizobium sp. BAC0120 TaxID=3090670 RepID=UPI00298C5B04|nr:altronate dehydratase family protein [Mesorhizobium sp. BAC0120]MDW6023649.1 altronate dehydratase family protein [Mesorhizobium sp. BAC0120]
MVVVQLKKAVLQLKAGDEVAVALRDIRAGEALLPFDLLAATDIPFGHKAALRPLTRGDVIHRLGQPIGLATVPIVAGAHVHLHNMGFERSMAGRAIATRLSNAVRLAQSELPTFDGYVRQDGRVGTRNHVGVLTSVNCSALVASMIADHFRNPAALAPYPGVDGVVALTHKSGCSVADGSRSMNMLRRTLGGYARHPNFSGVLLVGLGCEDNQIDQLVEEERLELGEDLQKLVIQETGGTRASVRRGIEMVEAMLESATKAERQPVPASGLVVGLQCGGSDSFSGISANPALGVAVDRLVACGGTAILSETPEIYGAENLLLERAASREVGEKLIGLLEWWEEYTKDEPQGFDNNPSPGNKAGGLTTILEKSLGAIAKGGTTNLVEVYGYGQRVDKCGLVFMDSPGFDPMSATGQVAGGANLIAFTTGRGSCFGCRPAPSIKLATNSEMFARMEDDMDINCGTILDSDRSMEELGEEIFSAMLATASGKPTKSELLGYGQDEFAPWHVNAWL